MSDLQRIWAEHPDLNDFGFGLYAGHKHKSEEERRRIFQRNRARLLVSEAEFEKAVQWIRANLRKRKTINGISSSYELKHVMESDIGYYCTNGVFIAAMIACGYRHEVSGPNAWFNVHTHSVRQAMRAAGWIVV